MSSDPSVPPAARLAPEEPDLVWFRGTDSVRFLDELISQEIAGAVPGTVLRSLLLSPDGKLEHILWVLRGSDEVGLATARGQGQALADFLSRFRIRVDVSIDPEPDPLWVVVGHATEEPGTWQRGDEGLRADVSWEGVGRTLGSGPPPALEPMGEREYRDLRIAAGEPLVGIDVESGAIPHSTGLVPLTVDFGKGCFLGQELVARMDSRGASPPSRLWRVEFEGAPPQEGAVVEQGEKEIGRLTSVGSRSALAILRRGAEPGDEVMAGSVPGRLAEARFTGS